MYAFFDFLEFVWQSFGHSVLVDLIGVAYQGPVALNSPVLEQKVKKSLSKWQQASLPAELLAELTSAVVAYRYS
jgi:hypothetical protein